MTRIKTRYKEMVDSELTTLWEVFEKGNWSYNHGWSGGPLSIMYKYMVGIQPTKPGFQQFQVFPEPIIYKTLKSSFSTVKGNIALDYQINGNWIMMDLLVPKGAEAVIRVPKGSRNVSFTGDSKSELMEDDTDISYFYYSLSEGDWVIKYEQ